MTRVPDGTPATQPKRESEPPSDQPQDLPPGFDPRSPFLFPGGPPPQLAAMFQAYSWQGPYPPPETLAKYGEIDPTLVNRLLKMAEDQGDHRRAIENKLVDSQVDSARRGMNYGLAIGLVGLGAAAYVATLSPGFGAVFAGLDLLGLVTVFVTGRRGKRPALPKKEKE